MKQLQTKEKEKETVSQERHQGVQAMRKAQRNAVRITNQLERDYGIDRGALTSAMTHKTMR